MLSLQLKSGEYLSIGDDIAVQIFEQSGSTFRVSVKAPREIPILRSDVLERTGQRPEGLHTRRTKSPSAKARDARRIQEFEAKCSQAEMARQQTAALQSAATQELLAILSTMRGLTMEHETDLRGRLHAVETALAAAETAEQ